MKVYRQVSEDAEYREYYDSYRITVDNLNNTDFLYKSMLSNGQVFFDAQEVYGFVNNQAAIRGRNLTITKDYIDNFVIRDFKVFTRATNDLIDININCNLKDYRDNKMHYLYIVLSHRGKYEVHDDMFQSDETKLLFARFIIDKQGNSKQFYMMLPFAGSADYIKGNQFYQVTDGLRVEVVNTNTRQLTLTNAKIRFSGINFDDVASPDCLEVDFEGKAVPIRYCYWDNTDKVPRVDWDSDTRDNLDLTKIMNYTSGSTSAVSEGKWSIQKLYYDVYEKCIVALYGDKVYDSKIDAIYGIDSVMSYKLPDGIEYLIPIAAILAENTTSTITDENWRIVNLDYNEKEVLDSDTFTRQQSAEAAIKARAALDRANEVDDNLSEHVGDRTNPHRVRLDQLYNSSGNAIVLDDNYAEYTVSQILASAAASASNIYYPKTGGVISGNVEVGTSDNAKSLTVYGTTTLKKAVTVEDGLSIQGALTTNSTNNIGTSSSRFGTAYLTGVNTSGASTIGGALTVAGTIFPSITTSYDLGSSSKRFDTVYSRYINTSSSVSVGGTLSVSSGGSISGNLSVSGNASFSSRVNVNNGYIIIGGKALCLGKMSGLPVSTGYAIE